MRNTLDKPTRYSYLAVKYKFFKTYYRHNWRARAAALWHVLTRPAFVVFTCNKPDSLTVRYNVSYKTYDAMHQIMAPKYASAELNSQVDSILKEAIKEDDGKD